MKTNQNKILRKNKEIVNKINDLAPVFSMKSNLELKQMTTHFKERLSNGETLNDILVEAFATVREASKRVLNMYHYDVQLNGGIVLHNGGIAEMKTGEGKTLVATTAVYLNALSGKGVHVVTVNDYLAKRDKEIMSKLYSFLGLTTGVILQGQSPIVKKQQYACDITYGTNNEFGFDYLRDNMVDNPNQKIQRELNFAIVDEVDSILIDEARTPLIISAPGKDANSLYLAADSFCSTLKDTDYDKDEKLKSVSLTEEGISKAEKFFGISNLMDIKYSNIQHHINQALLAHFDKKKEVDYIVKNGEVLIVDEFTGRIMEGRRYSAGLHQAIEAKEGVKIKKESTTLATITFQNYFRLYNKLSGMTGTAKTEEEEFKSIYNLDVIQIPTNKPVQRIDNPDRIYVSKEHKLNALIKEITMRHQIGQPILVGTVSISDSELISKNLKEAQIPHNVLNAKNHEKEAAIIAQAGRFKAVTIATNMAGRGTDIIIGGNAEILAKEMLKEKYGLSNEEIECINNPVSHTPEEEEIISNYQKELELAKKQVENEYKSVMNTGGLCVIGTERHESRRIDNQLRGRTGRQGDYGESIFFISLDDDLMRIFGGEAIQKVAQTVGLNDTPLDSKMLTKRIEKAQMKVESRNFSTRKQVVKYDDILNTQRQTIYKFRDEVLQTDNVMDYLRSMIDEVCQDVYLNLLAKYGKIKKWDLDEIEQELLEIFPLQSPIGLENIKPMKKQIFIDHFKNILITELLMKEEVCGAEHFYTNLKFQMLSIIDNKWIEHIDTLNNLKDGIHLRSIGQEDPVIAYRMEGIRLYDAMTINIAYNSIIQALMM